MVSLWETGGPLASTDRRQTILRTHRMTIDSAPTGRDYEVTLESTSDGWVARWRTLRLGSVEPSGPSGQVVAPDAERAFCAAKRQLEDIDPALIDRDWDFAAPLPPWLTD